jgi:hypothetical protein
MFFHGLFRSILDHLNKIALYNKKKCFVVRIRQRLHAQARFQVP